MKPLGDNLARTMLLTFNVANVRSFRDSTAFSLEAASVAEPGVPRRIPWRADGKSTVDVLPAACVFGANASGKTNLLRAMDDMRDVVLQSYRLKVHGGRSPLRRLRHPFLLDPRCRELPSRYEIELVLGGVRHGYGFEISDEEVLSEWAWRSPKGRAATIFRREGMHLSLGESADKSAKSRAVRELLRPDSLFLSVAAAADYEELEPLYGWFERNLVMCDASSRERRWGYTANLMAEEVHRDQVISLLRIADLGISDARNHKPDPHDMDVLLKLQSVVQAVTEADDELPTIHLKLDGPTEVRLSHSGRDGASCELESSEESLGTLVWLGLLGPVIDSLSTGTVLLADELEASLHPHLVEQLVRLYQDVDSNPFGAQLIFNSHEARLLGNSGGDRVIGRDQAWFAEKMNDGATHLYPLTDMAPRKSEAIAHRYMQGRYGAVPIISPSEFSAVATGLVSASSPARDDS